MSEAGSTALEDVTLMTCPGKPQASHGRGHKRSDGNHRGKKRGECHDVGSPTNAKASSEKRGRRHGSKRSSLSVNQVNPTVVDLDPSSEEDLPVHKIEYTEVLTKSSHATMLSGSGRHEDVRFIANRMVALERKVQDQDAVIRVLLLENRRVRAALTEQGAQLAALEEHSEAGNRSMRARIAGLVPVPVPPKRGDSTMLGTLGGRRISRSSLGLITADTMQKGPTFDHPRTGSEMDTHKLDHSVPQSKVGKDKTRVFKPRLKRGHKRSASTDSGPNLPLRYLASTTPTTSADPPIPPARTLPVITGHQSLDVLSSSGSVFADRTPTKRRTAKTAPEIHVERDLLLSQNRRAHRVEQRGSSPIPTSSALSPEYPEPQSQQTPNSTVIGGDERLTNVGRPRGLSVTRVKGMFDPEYLESEHVSSFIDRITLWEEEQVELERTPRGRAKGAAASIHADALNCRFVSTGGAVVIPDSDILGSKLYNFRDIAEVCSEGSPLQMSKGKIYRSACLSRGNPSQEDLRKTLVWLRDVRGIKTLIDFRDRNEKQASMMDEVLIEQVFPTVRYGSHQSPRRFWIPMYNTGMKMKGLFWGCTSKRMKASLCKRAIQKGKDGVEKQFSSKVMGEVGLDGLNKLTLKYSGEEIRQCLQICSDPDNYPIMFHCSSGKDRTGLIAMLIQKSVGLDHASIMRDYVRSQAELKEVRPLIVAENSTRGLPEVFADVPAAVMDETIDHLSERHGGLFAYFGDIGFTKEHQHRLISNLCVF